MDVMMEGWGKENVGKCERDTSRLTTFVRDRPIAAHNG
jgi:hypothetical protein